MAIQYVKIQWYKNFANTKTKATGDDKQGAGLIVLSIDKNITDHFNIPASAEYPSDAAPISKITGFSRAKVGIALNTPTETGDITTPDYFRLKGAKNNRDKVARVKTSISYTTKANKTAFRSVGIPFPLWFDTLMISQALGTMIKGNKPYSYSLSTGRSGYPILYADTGALLTSGGAAINKGAWVLQPTQAAVIQNVDDLDQVAATTPVQPAKPPKP